MSLFKSVWADVADTYWLLSGPPRLIWISIWRGREGNKRGECVWRGGGVRQRRASQQQVQSLIDKSHLSQSKGHSFHYSLTVLPYKRTEYWFKPRNTASRVQGGHRKRKDFKALNQAAPKFHGNTQMTSFQQPVKKVIFFFLEKKKHILTDQTSPTQQTCFPSLCPLRPACSLREETLMTCEVNKSSTKKSNSNSHKKDIGSLRLVKHCCNAVWHKQAGRTRRKEKSTAESAAQEQSCNESWRVAERTSTISISVGVAFMRSVFVCAAVCVCVFV